MLYAQVVLRRWQALQRAGMGAVYAPHAPFQFSQLDFPVRMGGVAPPARTDQPVCLLMVRCPGPLLSAAAAPDLFKAGRAEMLGQDFAQHEQGVMQQLQAMFGPHGFDAQRDVAALTLNRWGHGYVWDEAEHLGLHLGPLHLRLAEGELAGLADRQHLVEHHLASGRQVAEVDLELHALHHAVLPAAVHDMLEESPLIVEDFAP